MNDCVDKTWEELVAGAVLGERQQLPHPLPLNLFERVPDDADGGVVADVARSLAFEKAFATYVAGSGAPWLYDFFRSAPETWASKWPPEFYARVALERWGPERRALTEYDVKELRKRGMEIPKQFWFKLTFQTSKIEARVECYAALAWDLHAMDEYMERFRWNGRVKGAVPGCH